MRSISQVLSRRAPADASKPNFEEKRFAPRRKDNSAGIVFLSETTGSIPCFVRDMSTTGAQLELRQGWDEPFTSGINPNDRIRLVLRTHRVVYECKIVRRGERTLGVKFLSAPRPLSPEDARVSTAALARVAKADGKASPVANKPAGRTPRA